jgi:hypothetical protein
MSTASFNGLLIISVIAVMAPILAASVRRVKLPSAVVEIVAGIIIGPSVLAWVKVDQLVAVVALLGLAFLLFLAGLEVDLRAMTPPSAACAATAPAARRCEECYRVSCPLVRASLSTSSSEVTTRSAPAAASKPASSAREMPIAAMPPAFAACTPEDASSITIA